MMRHMPAISLYLAVLCLIPSANAQLAIVDNIPGAFVPIPDGIELNLDTNETAPITTTIGNSLFPSGTLWIGSNGAIGIGAVPDTNLPPDNEPLPSSLAFGGGRSALPLWQPLWDDLDPDVRWKEIDDTLVIEWNRHVSEAPEAGIITFQLQVFSTPGASPPIYAQFIYEDLDAAIVRANPTIGYQVGDGITAVEWTSGVVTGDVLTLVPEPTSALLVLLAIPLLHRRQSLFSGGGSRSRQRAAS